MRQARMFILLAACMTLVLITLLVKPPHTSALLGFLSGIFYTIGMQIERSRVEKK